MYRHRYATFDMSKMRDVNISALIAVAAGVAAGHWLPGIVPVNAVLGGAICYAILNPLLNRVRATNSEMTRA